jgi:hypothetical protein
MLYLKSMETFLITFLCGQLASMAGTQYNAACTNFTNASFIQIGLHDDISNFQKDMEKIGVKEQKTIEESTGETPWKIAAIGYVGYNLVKTQTLQYSTGFRPIADRLTINANTSTQNIALSWQF